MIKTIVAGVWAVAVMSATYLAVTHFDLIAAIANPDGEETSRIETIPTDLMRVPVMADGAVKGYVLVSLKISYEAAAASQMKQKLLDFLTDEAFRAVYESVSIDFAKAQKTDLTALLQQIGGKVDKRLGGGVVKELMVKDFTFVPGKSSGK